MPHSGACAAWRSCLCAMGGPMPVCTYVRTQGVPTFGPVSRTALPFPLHVQLALARRCEWPHHVQSFCRAPGCMLSSGLHN